MNLLIHLDDTTAAIVPQNTPHTPATGNAFHVALLRKRPSISSRVSVEKKRNSNRIQPRPQCLHFDISYMLSTVFSQLTLHLQNTMHKEMNPLSLLRCKEATSEQSNALGTLTPTEKVEKSLMRHCSLHIKSQMSRTQTFLI